MAIKIPPKPGIYLLYKKSKIVYIGQAKNIKQRVEVHKKEFYDWSYSFKYIEFEWDSVKYIIEEDKRKRKKKEKELIKRYNPPFNTTMNTKNKQTRLLNYYTYTYSDITQ